MGCTSFAVDRLALHSQGPGCFQPRTPVGAAASHARVGSFAHSAARASQAEAPKERAERAERGSARRDIDPFGRVTPVQVGGTADQKGGTADQKGGTANQNGWNGGPEWVERRTRMGGTADQNGWNGGPERVERRTRTGGITGSPTGPVFCAPGSFSTAEARTSNSSSSERLGRRTGRPRGAPYVGR